MMPEQPIRILAIDVGAGTQDILVYEGDRTPENCVKLVMPSQTQVVGARIRRATECGVPIFLAGTVMGGGASSEAIEAHLAAGLPVYAAPDPARTIHNDLDRVRKTGIQIVDEPPVGAEIIWLGDVDLPGIRAALERFEVPMPSLFAIAAQDHGYLPGAGRREFRYEFLEGVLSQGGDILNMVYRHPPEYMTRMRAIKEQVPGAILMDTGAAAVLGILGDPSIARAVDTGGAILINIGNMHTFGVALRGRRIYGLFEHHTGGITPQVLAHLVESLRDGTLTNEEVHEYGGHGAAFDPAYQQAGPFEFIAITGPNRGIARELGYSEAVPHGDMMLSGPYGLVEGMLGVLACEGNDTGLTLVARY
jgi:uncharacterized protein (DUF1786 family)